MEKIEKIIIELCNKYGVDFDKITLSTFKGDSFNGLCSPLRIKDGFKFTKDFSKVKISINEKLLKNETKLRATVCHEFAHAIQILALGLDYTELKNKFPKVSFTSFDDNLLEIQAEAFAVYENGFSNHSKRGAVDMDCYQSIINDFLKNFVF